LVQCNVRAISTASDNNTFNYVSKEVINKTPYLALPYGGDVPYTFYDQPATPPTLNQEVAVSWQKYLMGIVLESNPNLLETKTEMHKYGEEAKVIEFSHKDMIAEIMNPSRN